MSKRTPEEIIHAVERYQRGETSQGAEAKRLGVSQQAFQDWVRKYETFVISGPCDTFLKCVWIESKKAREMFSLESIRHISSKNGYHSLRLLLTKCEQRDIIIFNSTAWYVP